MRVELMNALRMNKGMPSYELENALWINNGAGESESLTNNYTPKKDHITMKSVVTLYYFELF